MPFFLSHNIREIIFTQNTKMCFIRFPIQRVNLFLIFFFYVLNYSKLLLKLYIEKHRMGKQKNNYINEVLIGEATNDDDLSSSHFSINNYLYMKYIPLILANVERSFSMFKHILSPNRQRFSEDSLSKYMVVSFFFF